MSIETFYTAQSTQHASKGAKHGAGVSGAANTNGAMLGGEGMLGGDGSFFDMFLNNAMQALEATKIGTKEAGQASPLSSKEKDMEALMKFAKALGAQLSDEAGMDVEIFATNENVEEGLGEIETIGAEESGVLDVLTLDQQNFEEGTIVTNADEVAEIGKEDLPSIMAAFGIDVTSEKFAPKLTQLEKMLSKIEKLMAKDSPELSALNISPQQIHELKEQIEAIKAGQEPENADEVAAIMVGLIKILPPQAKPVAVVTGQSLMMTPKQLEILQNQGGQILPGNDLGGKATAPSALAPASATGDDGELIFFDSDIPADDADFQKLLKDFSKTGQENLLVKASADKAAAQGQNLPPAHVLQGWPFGNSGSLFGAMEYSTLQYDQMGLSTGGQMSLTSSSPLTSLVTQSHAAGQPHPGTQLVAANIQKAAGGGETKNIRIQLDPPELGRVEIKMSFDKNNAAKTVLSCEKPETFMMLQRDSHILERALQESGLDMSAEGSLSFEMADDGNFGQDGSHDGSRNQAKSAQGGINGEEEIIETTMNWHVDPSTGHMRYNILA